MPRAGRSWLQQLLARACGPACPGARPQALLSCWMHAGTRTQLRGQHLTRCAPLLCLPCSGNLREQHIVHHITAALPRTAICACTSIIFVYRPCDQASTDVGCCSLQVLLALERIQQDLSSWVQHGKAASARMSIEAYAGTHSNNASSSTTHVLMSIACCSTP